LDKRAWSTAETVRFDQAAFSRKVYPESETMVASCWTPGYLYLAFSSKYQNLNTYQGEDVAVERWQLWEKDVVEAFINPQPEQSSHYYEFEVAPNNQWIDLEIDLNRNPFIDSRWNSDFTHATRIDAMQNIWTAEMRIPVRSMKVERILPNTEWRINFYRADGLGNDQERRMLSWSPLPLNLPQNSFHQPASFGILRFACPAKPADS
jgi:Carbohydrate-binding family 9